MHELRNEHPRLLCVVVLGEQPIGSRDLGGQRLGCRNVEVRLERAHEIGQIEVTVGEYKGELVLVLMQSQRRQECQDKERHWVPG